MPTRCPQFTASGFTDFLLRFKSLILRKKPFETCDIEYLLDVLKKNYWAKPFVLFAIVQPKDRKKWVYSYFDALPTVTKNRKKMYMREPIYHTFGSAFYVFPELREYVEDIFNPMHWYGGATELDPIALTYAVKNLAGMNRYRMSWWLHPSEKDLAFLGVKRLYPNEYDLDGGAINLVDICASSSDISISGYLWAGEYVSRSVAQDIFYKAWDQITSGSTSYYDLTYFLRTAAANYQPIDLKPFAKDLIHRRKLALRETYNGNTVNQVEEWILQLLSKDPSPEVKDIVAALALSKTKDGTDNCQLFNGSIQIVRDVSR
jgi:hypothetical protein